MIKEKETLKEQEKIDLNKLKEVINGIENKTLKFKVLGNFLKLLDQSKQARR
jgi:uncharacterized protein YqfB (UPF0267 family)